MGFWKSERGINGDGWADEMGRCMKALSKDVLPRDKGEEGNPLKPHEITMAEFADLVEFCSRGHLVVDVRYPPKDGGRPLSELHCFGVETYPNRGQIHCEGEMIGREYKVEFLMCGHPELIPTIWGQEKPEPARTIGKCPLHDYACPVCGFGASCAGACNCPEMRHL